MENKIKNMENQINHITNTLKKSNEMWEIAMTKHSTESAEDFVKIIGMLQSNLRLLRQELMDIDNEKKD